MTPQVNPSSKSGQAAAVVVLLLVGAALGAGGAMGFWKPGLPAVDAKAQGPRFHCPMHPTYTSDVQGDCPICGMRLTPITADDSAMSEEDTATAGLAVVSLSPERLALLPVAMATAVTGAVSMQSDSHARLMADETRVHRLSLKAEAFVEQVHVGVVGEQVEKGQPLVTLYSPELYRAQLEFVASRRAGLDVATASEVATASAERLRLAGVPSGVVATLMRGGRPQRTLTLVAPISGTLTLREVVPGARLMPGDPLCEVTDLTQLWVVADLHNADLADIRLGTAATVQVPAFPELSIAATVTVMDPSVDPATRALRVRLRVANPLLRLRPEMFATVSWQLPAHPGVLVPGEAVLDSGKSAYVFVEGESAGGYLPWPVRVGMRMGPLVEILEGLDPGDRVVARAAFLIDSESRLNAALRAMKAGAP